MAARESELREIVAQKLEELIEPGLILIQTEFPLPNFHGAKGFIDILARDRYDLRVIIELKRSDSSARQALHELYKYTALMQEAHGLGPSEVRCVLVSTDWHELLVPFSAFVRSVPYTATGYRLLLDTDGQPVGTEAIPVLPNAPSLELCPKHCIYFFTKEMSRDAFIDPLQAAVESCGIEDYLLFSIQHEDPPERVVHPFAVYLAMASIDPILRFKIETEVNIQADPEEEEGADEWFFEESVQAEINRRAPSPDSFEIGYPDKWAQHEARWIVKGIGRRGRFASSPLRSDDDLIALLRGESEAQTVRFKDAGTPQYEASWSKLRANLRVCLLGSGPWEQIVELFLDEVEATDPRAHIEIAAFNPCDLLMALYKAVSEDSPFYFPTLLIIVTPSSASQRRALIGFLSWDGVTCPGSFAELVSSYFESDLFYYFLRRHFNELWQLEQALADEHGLSYTLEEVEIEGDDPVVSSRRTVVDYAGVLQREPFLPCPSIFDFCVANEPYLREIESAFKEMAIGL